MAKLKGIASEIAEITVLIHQFLPNLILQIHGLLWINVNNGVLHGPAHCESGAKLPQLSPKANVFARTLPMLQARSRAPEFVLPNDKGQDTSLSDLLQNGPLILYFYPADFTPGCTREACTIRDMHSELAAVGLQVAGVSPQDPESHARFRETHNLPFTLLCDPEKIAIRMYGVDGPFGVGVRRATFLIAQDRTISAMVLADIRIGRHAAFMKKAIILRDTAGMRAPSGKD